MNTTNQNTDYYPKNLVQELASLPPGQTSRIAGVYVYMDKRSTFVRVQGRSFFHPEHAAAFLAVAAAYARR